MDNNKRKWILFGSWNIYKQGIITIITGEDKLIRLTLISRGILNKEFIYLSVN